MGHAVAGDPAGPVGGHEAVGAEAHGKFGDLQRPLFEGFDDTEPIGVRKRAEGRGAVAEDLRVKRRRF